MKTLDDLRLRGDDALFLDFDGTLVGFGPDPSRIWLPDGADAVLERLSRRLGGALCIISGRDLRDLVRRVPDGVWRAGGHGLEIIAPREAPPEAPQQLPRAVADRLAGAERIEGVVLERKGPVAAIHYRLAPEAQQSCLKLAREAARLAPGYVVMSGKFVIEVKPEAADKGAALRRLMAQPAFADRRPVMLGDDTTDEDAMRAAQELGGLGVKVGEGDSVARLRSDGPHHVHDWLVREIGEAR